MSLSRSQRLTDAVYTVAEVADLLKLNQQTVRNWIDQGSLPALRIGRRVRIKREVVEDILEKRAALRRQGRRGAVDPDAGDAC